MEPGTETTPTTIRARTYIDLTDEEKLHESVDIMETNIVLQELSLQERESKLYDDFDTFTSMSGETIHLYYMWFTQLINDMHTIGMSMKPLQVNTKFVNHLQPEWSKFVTDVKLAQDMHTTNFDHLYAHLRQHEAHANEVRLERKRQFSWPIYLLMTQMFFHRRRYKSTMTLPIASIEAPQMVSSVKLPILMKGEYIFWTMKMKQYLDHTEYALWEVILNGNSAIQMKKDEAGKEVKVPPVTAHSPQLNNEDLEQIDQDNLEEMDLNWQVAMLSKRVKRFYKKIGRKLEFNRKEQVGFDKTKVEYFNCHRRGHYARDCRSVKNSGNRSRDAGNAGYRRKNNGIRPTKEEDENALVVQDELGTYDWSYQVEEEATDFALMAFTSNPSSSLSLNSEVQSCSKQCVQCYEQLKKLFDEYHEKLRKANLETVGYRYSLESIEGQLRVHHQNGVIYKEKIGVLEYDVKDKSNLLKYTQKQLDEALKEKEDLKAKLEKFETSSKKSQKFETSSKNLTKLLDTKISAKVKTGLGYDNQFNEKEVLDVKEEEVTETVFDNRSSDKENSLANDRFKKGEGYHAVPPHLTGNYMPPKSDLSFAGLDDSIYKFKISETVTSVTKDEKDAPETSTACVDKPKEDSMSHLIKDNIFHEDRMAKKSVLPNNVGKVFARFGRILVSAAKPKVAASTSAAKPVNTAGSKQSVHFLKSRSTFHKSHSPIRRYFYNTTTHLRGNSTERLNTAVSKAVSAIKRNRVTTVKTSTCYVWRPRVNDLDHISKENRRLGHVNFKTINKLVKGNLVRGLPSKIFKNDHTCVACQKEKQHKATYKAKLMSSINQPLHMLHMDLFGPTSVMNINHRKYFLVVTDDFSRFSWVFFLATKDETSTILKPFITAIENQLNKKVKVIRCDNGTEFKNRDLDELCGMKGIKREYNNARTPQQNGVAERKNKTRIEATQTILADSLLPITFWAEVVNVACYVLNRALVTKSHNKTPYELLNGRTPRLDFMRPFGCPFTILNTLDPLGNWLFDIDSLTNSMNYIPVSAGNQTDKNAGPQDTNGNADDKAADDKPKDDTGSKTVKEPVNKENQAYRYELDRLMNQEKEASDTTDAFRKKFERGYMDQRGATQAGSTNSLNTVSNLVNAASTSRKFSAGGPSSPPPHDAFIPAHTLLHVDQDDSQKPDLEDTSILRDIALMHKRFQMSSMGVLTFFLGLQVKQSEEGIFISQDKYVAEILKIFDFSSVKTASTPIETQKPLVKNEKAADVDVHLYRSMIRSLMYLTASRPDIMFAVCACSRFQVTPNLSQLHAVKRIFRYLKGQSKLGLWYPRDSPFDLEDNSDNDYAGANLDRKSTIREYVAAANCCGQVRAATTASLDAQQDSSNITKTQSKAKLNKPTPQGEGSGSGPGRQETIGGTMAQIRSEGALIQSIDPPLSTGYTVGSREDRMKHDIELMDLVPQTPYDSPLLGGHTPESDEGSITLKELTDLCTTLLQKVFDLENVKTAQAKKIASLKKRITKLEQRQSSIFLGFYPFKASSSKRHGLGRRKVSKQERKILKSQQMFQDIDDVLDKDADTEMIIEDKDNGEKGGSIAKTVSTTRPDISAVGPEDSTAEPKNPFTTATLFDDEDVTIADTLASKAALAEMYDKVQVQIDVDHELAIRLTHEEQEKYTVEERSKLLAEFFERRKKQLAKERAEDIRSKPPTKTPLRSLIMTYLKHTGSDKDEKRIGSRKKRTASSSSKHKSTKKQKMNDQDFEDSDKENRKCLKVVPDDDKAINYETLDVKSLIIDCESQVLGTNEAGDVHVYKLTRLDGSYKHFLTFSRMLEVLDRQDVLDLHKIIMERFSANDPEGYDLILWGDLKILVESSKVNEI
uniref:Putative ribonuclease H-like domain-containing protein n=1 Tax=Tanacetum cinerariifolium TaxID=118510 RepID=A0A6L2N3U6_TANCI|nr:putative ribonuclease H-like domain-containing protein [Tanacetum cinerariifolium]